MQQRHKNELLGSFICDHALQTRLIDPWIYQSVIRFSNHNTWPTDHSSTQ